MSSTIQMRTTNKDIVVRAWSDAVAEKATVTRALLIRTLIRAEIAGKEFCIGKIHKSRLDNPGSPKNYIIVYNAETDNDIADWLAELKKRGNSAPKLIKSYILRHVEVIDDNQQEYFPDYQDCLEINNTFVSYKPVVYGNTENDRADDSASHNSESTCKELIAGETPSRLLKEEEEKEQGREVPEKRKSSFAGLGGAARR